jgi:hypothetical protein
MLAPLPQHIQRRDAESGGALRALLAVINEQVDATAADIEALYADWFIETCADAVVPLIGDLVGYRLLRGYTEALASGGLAAQRLAARLAPRRDVADAVASRRRKGTLALLENLAAAVADWPARAVETGRMLSGYEPIRLYPAEPAALRNRVLGAVARTVDVRRSGDLDLVGGPFDPFAHLARSPRAVTVYVWRLAPHAVTHAPAYCLDRARNLFTFSILGADTPLMEHPVAEPSPTHIATAENVPVFLRRRAVADRLLDFYGPGRSFTIFRDGDTEIPPSAIVVADLTDWRYRPHRDQVLVDPELGRIAFGARHAPRHGVWVSYHYGFSDDIGGGEYPRDLATPDTARVYRVGPGAEFPRITDAYERYLADGVPHGIIEIVDSGAYQEQLEFAVAPGQRLEIRAADGVRPTLRLLDWYSNRPDALQIRGVPDGDGPRPTVVLDGLLVTGRGVTVSGPVGEVVIRDCTLVPGWSLEPHCAPSRPEEPSLVLEETRACLRIDRSILGTIVVIGNEARTDPLPIHLADSILDATADDREALSGPDCSIAWAQLHMQRTTVIGEVHTHAVQLGENSIVTGRMVVARRGLGCLRFCFVPAGSRTPRRFHCVSDPVRPLFTSTRYGTPAYGQLAPGCPEEIVRGADDGSELGAFHDLFQPQRTDNLRARLAEFSPAGTDAGLVFVT